VIQNKLICSGQGREGNVGRMATDGMENMLPVPCGVSAIRMYFDSPERTMRWSIPDGPFQTLIQWTGE